MTPAMDIQPSQHQTPSLPLPAPIGFRDLMGDPHQEMPDFFFACEGEWSTVARDPSGKVGADDSK
jgi:hypothetical protein